MTISGQAASPSQPVPCLPELDSRIPAWQLHELTDRPCPICHGMGELFAIRPDRLSVHKCLHCHTVYVSPAPTNAALLDFYQHYRSEHSRSIENLSAETARRLASASLADDFRLLKISALRRLAGANTLDIGCAEGEELARLRNAGAHAVGSIWMPSQLISHVTGLGFKSFRATYWTLSQRMLAALIW